MELSETNCEDRRWTRSWALALAVLNEGLVLLLASFQLKIAAFSVAASSRIEVFRSLKD
jgi:hypothetical protein